LIFKRVAGKLVANQEGEMTYLTQRIYNSSGQCAICLNDYDKEKDNDCLLLRCGHIFHYTCGQGYRDARGDSCPECRDKVILPLSQKQTLDNLGGAGTTILIFLALCSAAAIIYIVRDRFFERSKGALEGKAHKPPNRFIHEGNWHLWVGGFAMIPLARVCYDVIEGKRSANATRIKNYRPPLNAGRAS
jgi:Ring finger domain